MLNNKPHILFIDPYASVDFLTKRLRESGFFISAVYTNNQSQMGYVSKKKELFDQVFEIDEVTDEAIQSLILPLKALSIDRVYSGNDGLNTLKVTDKLASVLCPEFANPMETTFIRSDKFEMQEALRSANLPAMYQMKVGHSLDEAKRAELKQWTFPLILKPVNGAGSLNVVLCDTIEEIEKTLAVQQKTNIFGESIDEFIIQEYLQGEEYLVDALSVKGVHHVAGVQRAKKKLFHNNPIGLYVEIVRSNSEEAMACANYVKQVLSILQLDNGFSHTELMLTPRGPRLIEVNPRISGGQGACHKLFEACGYSSQISLLIADFFPLIELPQSHSHGRFVKLQNYQDGRKMNEMNEELLSQLPSFKEIVTVLKKPGDILSFPKNLMDTVAIVLLIHSDAEQLEKDYQQLLAWENDLKLF